MFGKWFSKPAKGDAPPAPPALSAADPPVGGAPYGAADPVTWDARTVIARADPPTLVVGGAGRRNANAFDAATMIGAGAGFEPATLAVGGTQTGARSLADGPLPAGSVLNSRYEVIKPIGRGGFSYVYLCQHQRNGRLNAVKEAFGPDCRRMGLQVVANEGIVFRLVTEALLREVTAIARINHPGIVRFEDVFEANGTLCFAMDFVEGEPLSSLLARRRGVAPDTFEAFSQSLLDAVDTLHANDVLHGDIKPGNIIVRPDKSIVLIDFGTAARLSDPHYEQPIVSPGYSPPERYLDYGDVGAWSDVYSCAATLAAALAGSPPPEAVSRGDAKADMAAYLGEARRKFGDRSAWIEGVAIGMSPDLDERPATIPDLHAVMGLVGCDSASRSATATDALSARGDGSSVFVSYAHADSNSVETLVRALQRRGVGVWIDRQGIKPGSRAWGTEIVNGMRGAQIVLLFSSARSMASENVRDEIYLAKDLGKPIIVARLDQAPFNDEVLLFLTRTQHIAVNDMAPPDFAAAIIALLSTQAAFAA